MRTVDVRRARMNRLFHRQKRQAAKRGIGFDFSFEQWVRWWENHLGPNWLEKRGRFKGQYVMARAGDKGDYHPNNVKCITCSENQSEQIANGTSPAGWNKGVRGLPQKGMKLSEEQAREIKQSSGLHREIAVRFGVTQGTVSRIKSGKNWPWIVNASDGGAQ